MTYSPPSNPLIDLGPPGVLAPVKYFQISFHHFGQPFNKEIDPVLSLISRDWLRYTANCWIICTQYDATAVFKALRPYLKGMDQMLILELKQDQNPQGWVPQWIWEWLNKKHR